MAFTDEDLKRLKEDLEKHGSDIFEPIEVWEALIDRLEAAETIVNCVAISALLGSDEIKGLVEAWRKAAGK